MKLWLLRPAENLPAENPWNPWYDRVFGFVVRAESEENARRIADENGGNEWFTHPWIDSNLSTCTELLPDGSAGLIIRDAAGA